MINSQLTFFLLISINLPSPSTPSGPCEDGQFDSITCTRKHQLLLTHDNQLYRGQCDRYPFLLDPEVQSLAPRRTLIVASLVDHQEHIYFFERERVILWINGKPFDLPMDQVFDSFKGQVLHAIIIWFPRNEKNQVIGKFMIQIYTTQGVFNYNEKRFVNGHPYWVDNIKWIFPWLFKKSQSLQVNSSMPPVRHLIGTNGKKIMSLIGDEHSDLQYSEAGLPICSLITYYYNLVKCIEENPENQELKSGPLLICSSSRKSFQSDFNILDVMIWTLIGLAGLSLVILLKCTFLYVAHATRRMRRRVRFSDPLEGDAKHRDHRRIVNSPSDEPDDHRYPQQYEVDSMAQSADSINETYKDINLSIDLKEDHFSKDPLNPAN